MQKSSTQKRCREKIYTGDIQVKIPFSPPFWREAPYLATLWTVGFYSSGSSIGTCILVLLPIVLSLFSKLYKQLNCSHPSLRSNTETIQSFVEHVYTLCSLRVRCCLLHLAMYRVGVTGHLRHVNMHSTTTIIICKLTLCHPSIHLSWLPLSEQAQIIACSQ